jgi:tubulin-specific chaperone D
LSVLCEVVKSGSAEQVQAELVDLMTVTRIVKQTSTFTNNTVVRKFNTKLISRIGLRLLPASLNTKSRKGHSLQFPPEHYR